MTPYLQKEQIHTSMNEYESGSTATTDTAVGMGAIPSSRQSRQSAKQRSFSSYKTVPAEYKSPYPKPGSNTSALFQKDENGRYNAATIVLIVFLVLIVVALIIAIIAVAVSPAGAACNCGPASTLSQGLVNAVTSGQLGQLTSPQQQQQSQQQQSQQQRTGLTSQIGSKVEQVVGDAKQFAQTAVQQVDQSVQKVIQDARSWLAGPAVQQQQQQPQQPQQPIGSTGWLAVAGSTGSVAAPVNMSILDYLQNGPWAVFKVGPTDADKAAAAKVIESVASWMQTAVVDEDTARLLDLGGEGTQVRRFDDGVGKDLFRGPISTDMITMYLQSAGSKVPVPTRPVDPTRPKKTAGVNYSTACGRGDDVVPDDVEDAFTLWGDDDVMVKCQDESVGQLDTAIPNMCSVVVDQEPSDDIASVSKIVKRPKQNQLDMAFMPPIVGLEYLDPQ